MYCQIGGIEEMMDSGGMMVVVMITLMMVTMMVMTTTMRMRMIIAIWILDSWAVFDFTITGPNVGCQNKTFLHSCWSLDACLWEQKESHWSHYNILTYSNQQASTVVNSRYLLCFFAWWQFSCSSGERVPRSHVGISKSAKSVPQIEDLFARNFSIVVVRVCRVHLPFSGFSTSRLDTFRWGLKWW